MKKRYEFVRCRKSILFQQSFCNDKGLHLFCSSVNWLSFLTHNWLSYLWLHFCCLSKFMCWIIISRHSFCKIFVVFFPLYCDVPLKHFQHIFYIYFGYMDIKINHMADHLSLNRYQCSNDDDQAFQFVFKWLWIDHHMLLLGYIWMNVYFA